MLKNVEDALAEGDAIVCEQAERVARVQASQEIGHALGQMAKLGIILAEEKVRRR